MTNSPSASRSSRRRPGAPKLLIIAGGLVAVIAGGMVAMSGGETEESKIDLYTVSKQSFEVTATASGELRAKKQTVLRSQLEKETAIVEIVEEGVRVKSGDVMVRLNGDDIQSELDDETLQQETARADMVAAESTLAIQKTENEASLRKAKVDVELAQVELQKHEQGDVVEKRLELNLAVEKGHRETVRLREKVERSQKLFDRQFLSEDELKKDQLEFIEAQAQLQQAEVALKAYEEYTYHKERKKLESDLDQAVSELDKTSRKAESELASKEADLINKRRQLELREDKVKKLEDQMTKTEVKAPTDGLVVYATSLEQNMWMNNQEPLNVGTHIQPNQEIIMLPDTSEMIAVVKVAENLMGRIKPGQEALLTIDAAQGKTYSGSVESIGIMAQGGGWRDPNVREYEVRINLDLDEEAHGLKPAMRCEGRIVLSSVEDVLAVPLPAVFSEGPHHFVYRKSGDRYEQMPVKVGRRSDTLAEVVTGLDGGELVLLREPPTGRIVKAKFEEVAADAGGPAPKQGRGPRAGAKPKEKAESEKPAEVVQGTDEELVETPSEDGAASPDSTDE